MDKPSEQKLLELKAKAWDTSVFIQTQTLNFQKYIAPHEAKLNQLIGEINSLSRQAQDPPKVHTSENKIVVTSDNPKENQDA